MKRYGVFEMVNGSIANGLMDQVEKLEKQKKELLEMLYSIRQHKAGFIDIELLIEKIERSDQYEP